MRIVGFGAGHRVVATVVVLTLLALAVAEPAVRASTTAEIVWLRQFTQAGDDRAYEAASDGTGVYVGGTTDWAFPGYINAGSVDAFVRKYGPDGNEAWTRQFGTLNIDEVTGISVAGGAVYVAGRTDGPLPGQTHAGLVDAFLRRYDPDGNEVWTREFGSPYSDLAKAVAADASGIYVAGLTYGTLPGQGSSGIVDAFVRKYTADGNEAWTRQFGTPQGDEAWAVSVSPTGVYVAGPTRGIFPGQTHAGSDDAFVRKYSVDGAELWTREFGTAGLEWPYSVSADATGVYVAGWTDGAFPGYPNAGLLDIFVRRYGPDGNEAWTRQFGTPNIDGAFAALATGSGVVVAGALDEVEYSYDAGDAFARGYDADGTEAWTLRFGTLDLDAALALAPAPTGFYVAGLTFGLFPNATTEGVPDAFVAELGVRAARATCPLSQGFWKNHGDAWPVDALVLGREAYDKADLLGLLRAAPRGDASVILAHQLIAAKLNVANGSDDGPIAAGLAQADALLAAHAGKLPYGVRTSTPEGRNMTATSEVLDAYNNRQLTPDCGTSEGASSSGESSGGAEEGPGTAPATPIELPVDPFMGSLPTVAWAIVGFLAALPAVTFLRRWSRRHLG